MNYNNLTDDQKESVWTIVLLLAIAAPIFAGACLLFIGHPVISVLLFISGLALTGLAGVGYYVEFVEESKD